MKATKWRYNLKGWVMVSLVSFLGWGCTALQREAHRVREEKVLPLGEHTPTAVELGLPPGSTLTLERGLMLALSNNPAVAIARRKAEAAQSRLKEALGGYWPQLSVNSSLGVSHTAVNGSSGGTTSGSKGTGSSGGTSSRNHPTSQSFQNGISINQLLYDFGKTKAQVRQALEEYIAARADLREAQLDVAFQFKQAFFNVLKEQELIQISVETIRQFEKRLEQVQALVEVGKRIRYDLTKAEVDLGNAQLDQVKAQASLRSNRAILDNVLGLAEAGSYGVKKPALEVQPREEGVLSLSKAWERTRAKNPSLQAQTDRVQAAVAALDAALANLYPILSLRGSLSNTLNNPPYTSLSNWLVEPLFNWVFYNGGTNQAQVWEAMANLRQARSVQAQIEQQVYLNLQQDFAQLEQAQESLKIVHLTVRQAEENFTLVQGLYQVGKATSVELTDAQVGLFNARATQVQATYDYQVALLAIKKLMGSE